MKHRVSSLFAVAVLMMLLAALSTCAAFGEVVVYLDEDGVNYGYQHPEATDPVSALSALASPPAPEFVGGRVLSSGVLPGTRVLSIEIVGDTTFVDFSPDIIGSELSEARLTAVFEQVKATLYQFGFTGSISLLSAGKPLSDYVKAPAKVEPDQKDEPLIAPIVGVGLGGRSITLSPGHGKRWNGSSWATARPVYCSPLNQEDYHNLENAVYLEQYLAQDGATVKMVRCTDKNYGASPWAGGEQWWRMGACYWLQHVGYPGTVYGPGGTNLGTGGSDDTNEIQSRPLSSDYDNTDIYVSLHTNGLAGDCSGTGCPTGTCTYYDAGTEHAAWGAVSQSLATAINNGIVDSIRTKYPDSGWSNRGVLNSNGAYGEIRIPDRAAALIELAFHDSCDTDAVKLRDNFFRSATMWGVYKGICDYFGTTPTWDFYSCEIVSHDIPTAMAVNEIRQVHVTLRNRGVLWNNAKAFRLGAVGDSDPFSTTTRQTISGEVNPNSTYTFAFNLQAPNTTGTFTTDWRMVRDGYTWFGPTVTQDIVVTGTPDNDPPTVPTNLAGNSTFSYRISLTWDPSTDSGTGVQGYNIYRNGVKIGSSITTSYTDNTCSPSTTYTYEVTAYDVVPNESAKSLPAVITSQDPDSEAPSVPANLHATAVTANSVSLAWNASTDNYGVTGYNIYRNNTKIGSSTTTSYTDNTCSPSTAYTYEVTAYDAIPNESARSTSVPVTTQSPYVTIWAEGFDGAASFNNWTVVSGYVYDTAQSKGTIPGAGSAYISTTAASQMWRTAANRPFAECKVSGYYHDLKGGYKAGTCGNSQRETLRLTADGTVSMFLEHGIYSAPSYATYNYRTVGGGGVAWTAIGNRWPSTNCNPAWIYFETTVTPGNPGASPVGTVKFLATDGGGTSSKTANLTTDFFSYGVGRVYLGLNLTSTHAGRRWDDIKIEATTPVAPIIGAATANSSSQITWTWTRADNNLFGFNIANEAGVIKSPQWPNSGWKNRASTSWAETGLAANTQYTRKVRAWNGSLDSQYSGTVSKYTLSAAPTASNVICSKAAGTWNDDPVFSFTAVGGFGAGTVQYYKFAWNQSPTYTWIGSEPQWDADSLDLDAINGGSWYLHVKGYNAEGVANGTLVLGPFNYDSTAPSAPASVDDGGDLNPGTTELSASWSGASDPESGIAKYHYAIGSTAGGNDIADWTEVTGESVTRTGLSLAEGSTYYFSVKAENGVGLLSDATNSDGIKVVADTGTIAQAKALDNAGDKEVALLNKAVTANFGDCIYIQEPGDGFSGIKVAKSGYSGGNWVSVAGIMGLVDGERIIQSAVVKPGAAGTMPKPLVVLSRDLGGESLNDYTPGFSGIYGLNNLGLLVTVSGKLTKSDTGYWLAVDGSSRDGAAFDAKLDVSMLSVLKKAELQDNDQVIVTGICQAGFVSGSPAPVVKLRGDADIIYYR